MKTGLFVLCGLACIILALMGWTFYLMSAAAASDNGRVQFSDAGQFTGLSLMFREVLGIIRSLWETEARSNLQDHVAKSQPIAAGPTGNAGDPVHVAEET